MSNYGPSRDMGGVEMGPANPMCHCNPMQAMFCPFGHMLECHIPRTCREAECNHYLRQIDNERDE